MGTHLGDAVTPVCLADFDALARARLDDRAWAYISGGAADEITLRENRAAWDALRLLPRVLQPLQQAGLSHLCRWVGQRYCHAVEGCVPPCGPCNICVVSIRMERNLHARERAISHAGMTASSAQASGPRQLRQALTFAMHTQTHT